MFDLFSFDDIFAKQKPCFESTFLGKTTQQNAHENMIKSIYNNNEYT